MPIKPSGHLGIAAATDAQRDAMPFINVGRDFDWGRYFAGGCHPSPDGYQMIAANVADAVGPLLSGAKAPP